MSSHPFIDTESFYLSPDISSTSLTDPATGIIPAPTLSKLKNLGPARLRDMRTQNSSMQILSHLPIDTSPKQCQKLNDALASSIVMNQDRFAGLALLPCWDAKSAAEELGRCVSKYRFVGGVLGFRRGEGKESDGVGGAGVGGLFEELWKVAERYRVPVFLRPLFPSKEQVAQFESPSPGVLPASITGALFSNLYTTHAVSPILLVRLYLSGAFDRHPNLRLVLSQNAHSIPPLLPRILNVVAALPSNLKPTRGFLDVWQHNIFITTADTLDVPSMRALLKQTPVDRVLGSGIMTELKESDVLAKDEWERVGWRNAEALFGLRGGAERAKREKSSY
ncbi:hypothetical protein K491DRAFT_706187 [Lophiostoma macrostomum CBS 122681]|uniref:Amidohydrolase-related domain-containing protein n=1 Tax=Lophiostoma macrostomum CBS 122681 TaxID=1314788 RepID=A0A6A6T210_9PLEO|nr:hypothetical protein K491DRAFT_706187 [Lophiostoma macrostomum CBS 122681]